MTSLPLTYNVDQCYFNAYINLRGVYKDRGLKLVIGSLGIHNWFEYGGRHWTKADFAAKMKTYSSDSHAWLEDADGNVYDYLHPEYQFWVKLRTGKKLKRTGLLEGVSKAELAKDGIEYVPADRDTQAMLFVNFLPLCKEYYAKMLRGEMGSQYGRLVMHGHAIGVADVIAGFAAGRFVGFAM